MTKLGKRSVHPLLRLGAACAAMAMLAACANCPCNQKRDKAKMTRAGGNPYMANVQKSDFGKTKDGKNVELYTLTNVHGAVAKIMTYGAILTEVHMPDRNGKFGDVVLGFDNFAQYEAGHPFFGAIAGRVANRIAKGEFELDGQVYHLAINNGPNTLHGGKEGFDKKIWRAEPLINRDGPAVRLSYLSPDMEENFPGNLETTVTYTLTNANEIRIEYHATTDKDTILNLTNHSYFNLSAFRSPMILDDVLTLDADRYTPTDDTLIPTGEIRSVKGTPYDFTTPHRIGERIEAAGGYDTNFVINGQAGTLRRCARAEDPQSGRVMEVYTTQPGVQFYTANFLDGTLTGIGGNRYIKNAGFCLETQDFPDAIHHANFPSPVLKPGDIYSQTTVYKFSTK